MGLVDGDVVQVTFKGECFLQEIILNQTYRLLGSFPTVDSIETDQQAIISQINGGAFDIKAAYLALLPPSYTLNSITCQRIWPTRTAYSIVAVGAPGASAFDATAANDALSVVLRTEFATVRKSKLALGQQSVRKIGPIGDGCRTGGNLTAGTKLLALALGVKLLTSITFTPNPVCVPTIFHRNNQTTKTSDLLTTYVPVTARVHRRRTVGVGS